MLSVMNDTDNDQRERLDAAKAAAPYIHARISYVETAEVEKVERVINTQPMTNEEFNEKYGVESASWAWLLHEEGSSWTEMA